MLIYGETGLTLYNRIKSNRGYTLFTPFSSKEFYLIDMYGRIVHSWDTEYESANFGYILENGNLIYMGLILDGPFPHEFGGASGVVVELDWDGNEVWRYEDLFMHHDFFRMDNGNIVVLRFDAVPDDEIAKWKGGMPESERKGVMWISCLNEIDRSGQIVWEWNGRDHFDPNIDIIHPLAPRSDFDHFNSCEMLPDGNIMLTSMNLDNIYIIEKLSGDIIWRWGADEGELSGPHSPVFLENGNILVFDNGLRRKGVVAAHSRVLEINRESKQIVWSYVEESPVEFHGSYISNAQRLSNGNTLICEGSKGRIFEVTTKGEKVWEYISPFRNYCPSFSVGTSNALFRAHRYDPRYVGFKEGGFNLKKYEWFNGVYAI